MGSRSAEGRVAAAPLQMLLLMLLCAFTALRHTRAAAWECQ